MFHHSKRKKLTLSGCNSHPMLQEVRGVSFVSRNVESPDGANLSA